MWDLILDAALIGAHVQKNGAGFRGRDVKFLMELFWNWQSSFLTRERLAGVHNNQIKRALHQLVSDTWANQDRNRAVQFKLTRAGMIALLKRLRGTAVNGDFEEFLFGRYYLSTYRDRIMHFAEKTGAPMPLSFRTEILEMLDLRQLEAEKKTMLKREIRYFEERIRETENTVAFAKEKMRDGIALPQIVTQIEKLFPYELNHQKPLTHLLEETPEDLQKWELTNGNMLRISLLWKQYLRTLETQLKLL